MTDIGEQDYADGRILARADGAVGRITVNAPERRNAMSLAMWDGLTDALAWFEAQPDVRAVVLSGAGDKAFVSGADIAEFDAMRATEDGVRAYNARYEGADEALWSFPKPVIAEIRGFCVGGGMAMALSCDIRIAADNLRMGIPAARLGLGYGYTGLQRLTGAVGPAIAAEVMYSARLFNAAEALQAGLVNRVVPAADLAGTVGDLAATIAANAPLTVEAAKAGIRAAAGSDPEGARAEMDRRAAACSASADYAEGRRAFAEKRDPVFRRC